MLATDLGSALYVRKYALESVHRSEGRDPQPWAPGEDHAQRHILRTDPDGCFVAEIGGLVVGMSQGFVRGDIWFLSQLFVHPQVHARGIGQELLRLAMDYGRRGGCTVMSVVSSTSPVAQSLYMRSGMFAFGIGYRLAGPPSALLDISAEATNQTIVEDCAGWQDQVADLDRRVFGAERRQDHAWYLEPGHWPGGSSSFALTQGERLLGYGYAIGQGFIAPLAAREPGDQLPLLRRGAQWLVAQGVEEASMWVVSHNYTLMEALLSRGWKVTNWSFLKANRPFGQFDRYHPAGGILL